MPQIVLSLLTGRCATGSLAAAASPRHSCSAPISRRRLHHLSSLPQQRCSSRTVACLPNHLAQLADVSVDVMDASTAKTVATFLQPVLSASILLMFVRVPLSWYPNIDVKKFPWSVVVIPTEPLLGPTRKFVQPQGGVDLAPLVWVALLSFVNEILLGPQGILNLLQRKAQM